MQIFWYWREHETAIIAFVSVHLALSTSLYLYSVLELGILSSSIEPTGCIRTLLIT